jgi:hypothetical protein
MMTTLRALITAALVIVGFGVAIAKLPPAPPMDDKAKAAAEEKKAKDAAAAETAKQQQARSEDRVVARYQAEMKAAGKPVPAPQMAANSTPATPATPAASGRGTGTTDKGLGSNKPPEKSSNAHSATKTVR